MMYCETKEYSLEQMLRNIENCDTIKGRSIDEDDLDSFDIFPTADDIVSVA
jgi:hypothetical protein